MTLSIKPYDTPWSNSMTELQDKIDSLLWLIFFFGFIVGLFAGSIR